MGALVSLLKKRGFAAVGAAATCVSLATRAPDASAGDDDWLRSLQTYLCSEKSAIQQEKQDVASTCVGEKGSKNVVFEDWNINTYDDKPSPCTRKGNPEAQDDACESERRLNMWLKIDGSSTIFKGTLCMQLFGTFTAKWQDQVTAVDKLYTTDVSGKPIYSNSEFPYGRAVKIRGMWGMDLQVLMSGELNVVVGLPKGSDDCSKGTVPSTPEDKKKATEAFAKALGIPGFQLTLSGNIDCNVHVGEGPAVVLQKVPTSCKKPKQ